MAAVRVGLAASECVLTLGLVQVDTLVAFLCRCRSRLGADRINRGPTFPVLECIRIAGVYVRTTTRLQGSTRTSTTGVA